MNNCLQLLTHRERSWRADEQVLFVSVPQNIKQWEADSFSGTPPRMKAVNCCYHVKKSCSLFAVSFLRATLARWIGTRKETKKKTEADWADINHRRPVELSESASQRQQTQLRSLHAEQTAFLTIVAHPTLREQVLLLMLQPVAFIGLVVANRTSQR